MTESFAPAYGREAVSRSRAPRCAGRTGGGAELPGRQAESPSRLGSAVFKNGPECEPQQHVPRTRAPALFLKGTNSGGRGPRNVPRMRDRVHFIDGVGVRSHSSIRRPASPKRPPVGLADSSTLADKERATAATAPPHWRMCFLQQAQHLLGWPPDEYCCRSWDFRRRWLMARTTMKLGRQARMACSRRVRSPHTWTSSAARASSFYLSASSCSCTR